MGDIGIIEESSPYVRVVHENTRFRVDAYGDAYTI